jgi:hypothetical protein
LGHANEMTAVRWNDDTVEVSSAVSEVFDVMARLLIASAFGPKIFQIEMDRVRQGARVGNLLLDALGRAAISAENFVGGDDTVALDILDDVVIHMRTMPEFAALDALGDALKDLASDFFKVDIYDDVPAGYPAHHRVADAVAQNLIDRISHGDVNKAARSIGQLLTPRYLDGFRTLELFRPLLEQSAASLPTMSNDAEFRLRQEQGLSDMLVGAVKIEKDPIWVHQRGKKSSHQSAVHQRYSAIDRLVFEVLRRHLTADQLAPLVRYLNLRLLPIGAASRPLPLKHKIIRHLGSAA